MRGTSLADSPRMHALDFEGELLSVNDRPTIPVPAPRESGVRLRVARKSEHSQQLPRRLRGMRSQDDRSLS